MWSEIFVFSKEYFFNFILQLLMAAIFGAVIGYEREKHGQGAGFRTNIIICISACLMMQLSMHMEVLYRTLNQGSVVRIDPGRIASYAISSMGFLGAGAIIKGEGNIKGLTTAASMWLVTGLGLSIGAGLYIPATIAVLIAMVALYFLRGFKTKFLKEFSSHIRLKVNSNFCNFSDIENVLDEYGKISIEFITFHRDIVNQTATYDLRIISQGHDDWRRAAKDLRLLKGVHEIFWTYGAAMD